MKGNHKIWDRVVVVDLDGQLGVTGWDLHDQGKCTTAEMNWDAALRLVDFQEQMQGHPFPLGSVTWVGEDTILGQMASHLWQDEQWTLTEKVEKLNRVAREWNLV
jgi:hypothetical protein